MAAEITLFTGMAAFVLFTSGVNSGLSRQISANSLYAATLTTASALPSPPGAGDTAVIYKVGVSVDGIHSLGAGHNSLLSIYYGGAWLEADYLCNLYYGKNATA